MNKVLEHPNSEYMNFIQTNPEAARILEPMRDLLEMSALRDRLANPGKTVDEIVAGVVKTIKEIINPDALSQVSRQVGIAINEHNSTYGYGKITSETVDPDMVVKKVAELYSETSKGLSVTNKELANSLGLKASVMKSMEQLSDAAITAGPQISQTNSRVGQTISREHKM